MPISTYFTGSIEQRMSDDLHLAGVAERTRKGPPRRAATGRTREVLARQDR